VGVWICPGVEVCFTERPQMSLETLQEKYIYIIRKGESHVWQSYNVESCYLILRSHAMCMETHTLGFQTPREEVFGPQKHTIQTPNLKKYLEESNNFSPYNYEFVAISCTLGPYIASTNFRISSLIHVSSLLVCHS